MKDGFVKQEGKRVEKEILNQLIACWIVLIAAFAVLFFLTRSDAQGTALYAKLIYCIGGITLLATLFRPLQAKLQQTNYKNLVVHADAAVRGVAGKTIDAEAAQGKILVDAYMNSHKQKGERIVLLPSYLLLCRHRITAIPIDKIFWICPQVGFKGGPYIVRLTVFAENKIYHLVGTDIPHITEIAEHIDQHFPNVFKEFDQSNLAVTLEEVFSKDYNLFVKAYQGRLEEIAQRNAEVL